MFTLTHIIIFSALFIVALFSYKIHKFRKRINNYTHISGWSTYVSISDAIIVYILSKSKPKRKPKRKGPSKLYRSTHKSCVLSCFNNCMSVECYSKEICPICSSNSWYDLNKALKFKYNCLKWLCFWRNCRNKKLLFGANPSYSFAKTKWNFDQPKKKQNTTTGAKMLGLHDNHLPWESSEILELSL